VVPNIPGLLGLPRDYLNSQLGAWKTGQRRAQAPDCMAQIVAKMSTGDINAAASWLAAQALPASSKPAAALPPAAPGPAILSCGSAPAPSGVRP
jgi:cytochrome c553